MKKKQLKIDRETIRKLREVDINNAYPEAPSSACDVPGVTPCCHPNVWR